MATQTLLSLVLLLSLLAISATARPGRPFHPCHHTLILFSTSFPQNPQNPILKNNNFRRSQSITLFITEIIPTVDSSSYPSNSISNVNHHRRDEYDYDSLLYSSSLRDRTRDILSVVGSLLFGVGCGALTAAAMFLAWSLFAANRFYDDDDDDSDDEFDSNEDADASPKKMGYVAVPAAAAQEVV